MQQVDVNLMAVLLCGVASMVIGFVWYSKVLFGATWMKLSGISEAQIKKANSNMPMLYGTMFIASLVMAYVLAQFAKYAGALSLTDGVIAGFWAWLGFVATTMLTGVLYEGKPLKLYFITAGYQLVTLVVMGMILVSVV
jgi:hypothetical protein